MPTSRRKRAGRTVYDTTSTRSRPVIWPRKPILTPEHEREFERVGIEEVRRRLGSNTGRLLYGTNGPPSFEAQRWVRWKAECRAFSIRVGIGAAIVAALLAFVSCFVAFFAWRFPV